MQQTEAATVQVVEGLIAVCGAIIVSYYSLLIILLYYWIDISIQS